MGWERRGGYEGGEGMMRVGLDVGFLMEGLWLWVVLWLGVLDVDVDVIVDGLGMDVYGREICV